MIPEDDVRTSYVSCTHGSGVHTQPSLTCKKLHVTQRHSAASCIQIELPYLLQEELTRVSVEDAFLLFSFVGINICVFLQARSSFPDNIHKKSIPVTDRGGTFGCEMSRVPHSTLPDNQLISGDEVVSLSCQATPVRRSRRS
jgi:hypothetical protein